MGEEWLYSSLTVCTEGKKIGSDHAGPLRSFAAKKSREKGLISEGTVGVGHKHFWLPLILRKWLGLCKISPV